MPYFFFLRWAMMCRRCIVRRQPRGLVIILQVSAEFSERAKARIGEQSGAMEGCVDAACVEGGCGCGCCCCYGCEEEEQVT